MPAAGYELHAIAVEGLDRAQPAARRRARSLRAAPRCRARARLLARCAPDAVLGGGGYVAGPGRRWRRSALRMPLVLTEADSHLGLTNRLLAPFARRVCLAFPLAGRDGARYRVTGRPVPPAGRRDRARRARALRHRAGASRCVLVFGGSLGARSLNHAAVEAFAGAGRLRVLHVARPARLRGAARRATLPARLRPARVPRPAGLRATRSPRPTWWSRAPGGSVFEIAAARRAGGARALPARDRRPPDRERALDGAGAGAAVVIARRRAERGAPAREVGELLGDRGGLAAMAARAHGLARPDAAREVAGELLAAAARMSAGEARGAGGACTSSASAAPA